MLAIYKKELRSYFNSMIGYIFIAFFLVIVGIYFMVYNLFNGMPNFEYVLSPIAFLFIIIVPVLTMRIMAEENRLKTDQLLFTSPISITKIILGKYLAVFSMFSLAMLITCFYPLILSHYGKVTYLTAYSGIFGFLLLGGAYLALGVFISSLTESQVVSAVVCFIIVLLTYLMSGIASMIPADNKTALITFTIILLLICAIVQLMMNNWVVTIGSFVVFEIALMAIYFLKPTIYDGSIVKIAGWFSVVERYNTFQMGILDLSAIIYYISFIFIFLFLTIQSIQKRRWS